MAAGKRRTDDDSDTTYEVKDSRLGQRYHNWWYVGWWPSWWRGNRHMGSVTHGGPSSDDSSTGTRSTVIPDRSSPFTATSPFTGSDTGRFTWRSLPTSALRSLGSTSGPPSTYGKYFTDR